MRFVVLGALLVVVVASGCGGGDSGRRGTTVTRAAVDTRSPYVRSLAALCDGTRKRVEKVPRPATPAELFATTRQVNAIGKAFVIKLGRLRPAPAERARATELVRLYTAYWSGQAQIYTFLESGLIDLYRRQLLQTTPFRVQAEKVARQLGARECARQPVRK
jgi:hypothetical protein